MLNKETRKKEREQDFSVMKIFLAILKHIVKQKNNLFLLPTNFLSLFCFINTVLSDFNFGWIENLGKVFIILIFFEEFSPTILLKRSTFQFSFNIVEYNLVANKVPKTKIMPF